MILQYFCTSDISYELFPLKTPNFHLHSLLPADDFHLCIELLWLDVNGQIDNFFVQVSLRCKFFLLSYLQYIPCCIKFSVQHAH